MNSSVQNKTVLITGGSRGIGAATALLLAQKGYNICLNYRTEHQAAQSVVEQIQASGQEALLVQADISQPKEIEHLFQVCDHHFQNFYGLVNNAAILFPHDKVENIEFDRLRRVFETNVYGSFLCAREAIKRLALSHGGQGGSIVNLSSIAARLGSPFEYIDYAATKGAIDTFTRGLGKELAQEGVRVNAVSPGIIDTEIHASGGDPLRVEKTRHRIPLKREGTAKEIAHTIAWLLSPESSYVTGSIIDVGGGL